MYISRVEIVLKTVYLVYISRVEIVLKTVYLVYISRVEIVLEIVYLGYISRAEIVLEIVYLVYISRVADVLEVSPGLGIVAAVAGVEDAGQGEVHDVGAGVLHSLYSSSYQDTSVIFHTAVVMRHFKNISILLCRKHSSAEVC